MASDANVRRHATSDISNDALIGAGSSVWHGAQIREGARLGRSCIVGKGVYIDFDVVIGDNVKIQNYACIYHGTIIDDGVFVGPHAVFTNDLRPRAINPDGTAKKDSDWSVLGTTVRFGASIGAASVILPGLTIDRHALIGAGSVVTRSVPAHGIVVGNPAKLVGYACVCAAALIIEDLVGVCPSCARQYTMTDLDGTFQFRVKEWIG